VAAAPGQTVQGQLGTLGAGEATGFKYKLDAAGALAITVESLDAPTRLDLIVVEDGNVPVASNKDQATQDLIAKTVGPGDVYVVVAENSKGAVALQFELTASFTPVTPE